MNKSVWDVFGKYKVKTPGQMLRFAEAAGLQRLDHEKVPILSYQGTRTRESDSNRAILSHTGRARTSYQFDLGNEYTICVLADPGMESQPTATVEDVFGWSHVYVARWWRQGRAQRFRFISTDNKLFQQRLVSAAVLSVMVQ